MNFSTTNLIIVFHPLNSFASHWRLNFIVHRPVVMGFFVVDYSTARSWKSEEDEDCTTNAENKRGGQLIIFLQHCVIRRNKTRRHNDFLVPLIAITLSSLSTTTRLRGENDEHRQQNAALQEKELLSI